MSQKRITMVGLAALAALIVFGCLVIGGFAVYRSGQSQGYMMGRLSASGDDGAIAPYAPYGFGYPSRHSSFAPFLCSAGLFVLLLVAAGKFFRFRAWKAAGGPEGERWARHWPFGKAPSRHGAQDWHRRHGPMPPWCWGWEKPPEEKAEEAEPDAETGDAE